MGLEKRQSLSVLPAKKVATVITRLMHGALPLSQAKTVGEEGTEAWEDQSMAQGVSWQRGGGGGVGGWKGEANLGLRLKA